MSVLSSTLVLMATLCSGSTLESAASLQVFQPSSSDLQGSEFHHDIESVRVKWSGIDGVTEHDCIAMCVLLQNQEHQCVKWKTLSEQYLESGDFLRFKVMNLRHKSVSFQYFRNCNLEEVPLAISDEIRFVRANAPMHPRLSPTSSHENGIRVSWSSGHETNGVLQWKLEREELWQSSAASSITYTKEQLQKCAAEEGWFEPGYFQHAIAHDLKAGATYEYRFGSGDSSQWSAIHRFRAPDFKGASVEVLIVGDSGRAEEDGAMSVRKQQKKSLDTMRSMYMDIARDSSALSHISLVLHLGDLSYTNGRLYGYHQAQYQASIVSSMVPMLTLVGNHEFGNKDGGEVGVPFRAMFPQINGDTSGNNERGESISIGSAFLVTISSTHNEQEQQRVLRQQLELFSPEKHNFLIVALHEPMYVPKCKKKDMKAADVVRQRFEHILNDYPVDLVLSGHVHAVSQTAPMRNGEECAEDERCPVHVIVGNGGRKLSKLHSKQPQWIRYLNANTFGYVRMRVSSENLVLEVIDNDNINDVMHSISIPARDRPQPLST